MSIYTNTGLVKHAEKALALNTKYMWGGVLRLIEKQYDMLIGMYGNKAGTGYTAERRNELKRLFGKGFYGVDCVGLIKSYYWSGRADGGTGSPKYGAAGYPDVNAGGMYAAAKVKGRIADMPETPGIILISRKAENHVGIYIGSGDTIESTLGSRGDGVVRHKLDKTFWTDWFECPYIVYTDRAGNPIRAIVAGDRVTIKSTAKYYSGTTVAIPSYLKTKNSIYSVAGVFSGRALLKELFSWVDLNDLDKV